MWRVEVIGVARGLRCSRRRIFSTLLPSGCGNNIDGLAIKIAADIAYRNLEYCLDRIWCVVCHMGAEDDIIEAKQWMTISKRLFSENIKASPPEVAAAQCANQSRFVDQASPRSIDERGAHFHIVDFIGSQNLVGVLIKR